MINFTCQLGWAMMSRCLVKYYSGCFSEGVFWMRVIFKLVECKSSKADCPLQCGWVSSNHLTSLEEKGILLTDCLRTQTATHIPWVSSQPDYPTGFRCTNAPYIVLWTNLLKYIFLHIYISYWFCLCRELD